MSAAADALMGIFGFKRVEIEMKTIEQTRRELFEQQMEALNKSPGEWRGNHYSNPYGNSAWLGFNAALDAVVIELPDSHCEAQDGYMLSCEKAIESTNLGLKIR